MRHITKKHALLISLLLLAMPAGLILVQETCDYKALGWCWRHWSLMGMVGKTMLWPSILFLVTVILMLPLPLTVFERWKRFAVWGLPVLIVITYLMVAADKAQGSGLFNYSFAPVILMFLYGTFIIVSFAIIIKGWARTRRASKKGKLN